MHQSLIGDSKLMQSLIQDGPALRAITLTGFADYLLDRGTLADVNFVQEHLYKSSMPPLSVIKADLEYVAKYWDQSSFDLCVCI